MLEEYDTWNDVKKDIAKENVVRHFKEREIFYMKMGKNLGFEQNGKGEKFIRPVIILKKFNRDMFFGVPLSSQEKDGIFYHNFEFQKSAKVSRNIALLSQMRLFSATRLLNKIGMISKNDFVEVKEKLKRLID